MVDVSVYSFHKKDNLFTVSPSCIDRIITKDNDNSHIVMNDKQAIDEGKHFYWLSVKNSVSTHSTLSYLGCFELNLLCVCAITTKALSKFADIYLLTSFVVPFRYIFLQIKVY